MVVDHGADHILADISAVDLLDFIRESIDTLRVFRQIISPVLSNDCLNLVEDIVVHVLNFDKDALEHCLDAFVSAIVLNREVKCVHFLVARSLQDK